jgi:biopolymer transport protein TolQ
VPAGVAYNQFTARLRIFASGIDDFARELLNSLEEIPQRSATPQASTGGPRAMNPLDREV